MKELLNLQIDKIYVEKGEESIIFITDKRTIKYTAYGDCCSETWFADIIGIENLLGQIVKKVEDIDMPETYNTDDGRCRQECDSVYSFKITTDKGYCDIIFRNSSNGYYGGNLEEGQIIESFCKDNYREITEDWSA